MRKVVLVLGALAAVTVALPFTSAAQAGDKTVIVKHRHERHFVVEPRHRHRDVVVIKHRHHHDED